MTDRRSRRHHPKAAPAGLGRVMVSGWGCVLLLTLSMTCGKSSKNGPGGTAVGGAGSSGEGTGASATGGGGGTSGDGAGGSGSPGGSASGGSTSGGSGGATGSGGGGAVSSGGSGGAGQAGEGGSAGQGSGGGSGGTVTDPLCLPAQGGLQLVTQDALLLDIDVSDDRYCTGASVFGEETEIGWTIPQGGGVNVLVTVTVRGLSPGTLLDDATADYELVVTGEGGIVFRSSDQCSIDITTNAIVPNQPTLRRVVGSVTCTGFLAGDDPEGSLLQIVTHRFETAIATGP